MTSPLRPRRRRLALSCLQAGLLALATLGPAGAQTGYALGPQDKIRVKAFEWRPSRDEIFTWEALNDEYVVGADGRLMLPLVGDVQAAGITLSSLAATIGGRLKTGLGLVSPPDISIEIVQFRPFYITGQVEKPGEYPYRPGLTVTQAVALAGGLTRMRDAALLRLEREFITSEGELRALRTDRIGLEVRRARLEAELADAASVTFPSDLDQETEVAKAAMRQEGLIFAARNEAFKTQTQALNQLKAHLEKELKSLGEQLEMEDRQIGLVRRELQGLTTLVEKGLAVAPRQMALERTLTSVESDKLKMGVSLLKAYQEIAKAEIGVLELRNKRANDIATELRDTQAKLDAVTAKEATARELLEETEFASPLLIQRNRAGARPVYRISSAEAPAAEPAQTEAGAPVRPGDTLTVELILPDNTIPLRGRARQDRGREESSLARSRQ